MAISSPTYHTWKTHGMGLHLKSKENISHTPLLHAGVTGSKLQIEMFLSSFSLFERSARAIVTDNSCFNTQKNLTLLDIFKHIQDGGSKELTMK